MVLRSLKLENQMRVKSETTDSDGDTIKQIYWRIRVGKPSARDGWGFGWMSGWYSDHIHRVKQEASMSDHLGLIKQTMQAKGDGYSTTAEVTKNGRVSAAQSTAVRRSFRIDNIPAGEYEVRNGDWALTRLPIVPGMV